jgi:hypothetical protein
MLLDSMLMKLKSNVSLALAAAAHLFFEPLFLCVVAAMPTDEFRSLHDGRMRLRFTFVAMLSMKGGADWAFHKTRSLWPYCSQQSSQQISLLRRRAANHLDKSVRPDPFLKCRPDVVRRKSVISLRGADRFV